MTILSDFKEDFKKLLHTPLTIVGVGLLVGVGVYSFNDFLTGKTTITGEPIIIAKRDMLMHEAVDKFNFVNRERFANSVVAEMELDIAPLAKDAKLVLKNFATDPDLTLILTDSTVSAVDKVAFINKRVDKELESFTKRWNDHNSSIGEDFPGGPVEFTPSPSLNDRIDRVEAVMDTVNDAILELQNRLRHREVDTISEFKAALAASNAILDEKLGDLVTAKAQPTTSKPI